MRFLCKRFLQRNKIIKMPEKQHTSLAAARHAVFFLALVLGPSPALAANPTAKDEAKTPPIATEEKTEASLEQGSAGSYLSSRFARQNGDVEASILYLGKALEKNPGNTELAAQLLAMQVAKGEMNAALTTATKLQDAKYYDADFSKESFTNLYPFLPAHFDILLHLLGALAAGLVEDAVLTARAAGSARGTLRFASGVTAPSPSLSSRKRSPIRFW